MGAAIILDFMRQSTIFSCCEAQYKGIHISSRCLTCDSKPCQYIFVNRWPWVVPLTVHKSVMLQIIAQCYGTNEISFGIRFLTFYVNVVSA